MTSEELLKSRYKVISDYPNSLLKIGQILHVEGDKNDIDGFEKYPTIFQKLDWWEERDPEEIISVGYLKEIHCGAIYRVISVCNPHCYYLISNEGIEPFVEHIANFLPSSKEELAKH